MPSSFTRSLLLWIFWTLGASANSTRPFFVSSRLPWYLQNPTQPEHTTNASNLWAQGIRVNGIAVAVVGDGIDTSLRGIRRSFSPYAVSGVFARGN
jgi:hypothetical protein